MTCTTLLKENIYDIQGNFIEKARKSSPPRERGRALFLAAFDIVTDQDPGSAKHYQDLGLGLASPQSIKQSFYNQTKI